MQISEKSDIYSFGIILFGLITGKPVVINSSGNCIHILEWVFPLVEEGDIQNIMDPRLPRNFSTNSAQRAIETAMACVLTVAPQRPDINYILAELRECFNLETLIHGMGSPAIEWQRTEIYAS